MERKMKVEQMKYTSQRESRIEHVIVPGQAFLSAKRMKSKERKNKHTQPAQVAISSFSGIIVSVNAQASLNRNEPKTNLDGVLLE